MYANGNVYEGEFVDGQKSGFGKFIWNNGKCYEGLWENGNMKEGVIGGEDGQKVKFEEGKLILA